MQDYSAVEFDIFAGDVVAAEDDEPLDNVAEFAYIAGPTALLQGGDGRAVEGLFSPTLLGTNLLGEVIDEERYVFFAVVETGHVDWYDIEPVEEVFAEAAFVDFVLQVFVGSGEDTHIDFDGFVGADACDFTLLQCAEHFSLCCE